MPAAILRPPVTPDVRDLTAVNLPPVVTVPQRSLALASLDIGRVLADRDGVTFRVQGTCMYPLIRPGDVLHIRSCPAAKVSVGDIAVCRGPGYLFSHRVISTGQQDGRAYIVTRPDRSPSGGDAPTFDENLLGVVESIQRRGRPVPLALAAYSWPARRYFAVHLALLETKPRLLNGLLKAAATVQDGKLYQSLARRGFALRRPHLDYRVSVPLNAALGDTLVRQLALSDFDPAVPWQGRPIDRWSLSLFVNEGQHAAAWISLGRGPGGDWQIEKQGVRLRFRGLGLDHLLEQRALEVIGKPSLPTRL
jgi:hypothetical protein